MSTKQGPRGELKKRDLGGSENYQRSYYEAVTLPAINELRRNATRKHVSWTEKEDNKLLELDAQGLTYAEIAAKLKRTLASVSGRLYKLRQEGRR